jgi:hypothetical protein
MELLSKGIFTESYVGCQFGEGKNMQSSLELRWFNKGALPNTIARWFESDQLGAYVAPPEERNELYLQIPNCDYVGLKLRAKDLEVRWRMAQWETVRFGKNWEGTCEKWLKWFCPDNLTPILPGIQATGQWVEVKKKRSLRLYQVLPGGSLASVPLEVPVLQGCNMELLQLSINAQSWWCLAFEVFGQESSLMNNLQTVGNWVSQTYQGQSFQRENSYSYPHWLNTK